MTGKACGAWGGDCGSGGGTAGLWTLLMGNACGSTGPAAGAGGGGATAGGGGAIWTLCCVVTWVRGGVSKEGYFFFDAKRVFPPATNTHRSSGPWRCCRQRKVWGAIVSPGRCGGECPACSRSALITQLAFGEFGAGSEYEITTSSRTPATPPPHPPTPRRAHTASTTMMMRSLFRAHSSQLRRPLAATLTRPGVVPALATARAMGTVTYSPPAAKIGHPAPAFTAVRMMWASGLGCVLLWWLVVSLISPAFPCL